MPLNPMLPHPRVQRFKVHKRILHASYPVLDAVLVTLLLLAPVLVGYAAPDRRIDRQRTKRFQSKEIAFNYPADFKVSTNDHNTVVCISSPSRSDYWEHTITIRKLNKKTEECDIPQDSHPDNDDSRSIAGHRANAYSGEDVALNRYVRRKGYFIEDNRSCWNFELARRGRPYQQSDLSSEEIKRLDKQSDQDSKKANATFNMVLDSFVLRRK